MLITSIPYTPRTNAGVSHLNINQYTYDILLENLNEEYLSTAKNTMSFQIKDPEPERGSVMLGLIENMGKVVALDDRGDLRVWAGNPSVQYNTGHWVVLGRDIIKAFINAQGLDEMEV